MPTAADALAAAERRASQLTLSRWAAKALTALCVVVGAYLFGHHQGRVAGAQDRLAKHIAVNDKTLDTLHRAIARTQGQRDTIDRAAQAAVERSAALVPVTAKAKARVAVAKIDTTANTARVTIDPGTDSSTVDSIPAPVAQLLVQLVAQRSADSLAITRLGEDLALARRQITMLTQADSIHGDSEASLKQQVSLANHAGFWKGVKVGAGVAGLALLVLLRH